LKLDGDDGFLTRPISYVIGYYSAPPRNAPKKN
jgi:hypothetical protein